MINLEESFESINKPIDRRGKENKKRFLTYVWYQIYKVHLLIKLSGCCLFTNVRADLSPRIFAEDDYHQPSFSNLFLPNVSIQCMHQKKSKPAAAIIVHPLIEEGKKTE